MASRNSHSSDLLLVPAWLRPLQASARRQHPARRAASGVGVGLVTVASLVAIAAWVVPPLLDWGRFRGAIAAFAAAELGRPVVIGGDVTLRLLPEAVLTASDVTLPDRGDGVSAKLGSLRLQVRIFPLFAGRIAVHDLVLGSPVLTLPWPLPAALVNPVRPNVPHPFAAHVEGGTLRVGLSTITGITAAIHGGPSAPAAPDATASAAFGAEGFAAFVGRTWRFTSALGAPDADGVSALDLAVRGQGPVADTGGRLQGTLLDGTVQGRLNAGGPDLSLLLPASRLAWHAEAPFVATGDRIESKAITLSLGGAPATAMLDLHLAAPARLDASLDADTLDLNGWAAILMGKLAAVRLPAMPMRISVNADTATLIGGTLRDLEAAVLFEGGKASLDDAQATLPGGARLTLGGTLARNASGVLSLSGPAQLDAPDLRATLTWLRPLAPGLLDALPAGVLTSATLAGSARLEPDSLSASGLTGTIDGNEATGGFGISLGARTGIGFGVTFDHLTLDPWFDGLWARHAGGLANLAAPFTTFDADMHLQAAHASWHGQDATGLHIDARTGAEGLRIGHAEFSLAGAHVSSSGTLGPGGVIAGGRLSATTPDGSAVLAALPPTWRWAPLIWKSPASLDITANGPPGAMDLQGRVEAGDLVAEAEARRDLVASTGTATLSLRHPGAPRLLAALGLGSAEQWLNTGSLAILAHVQDSPGHLHVQDIDLAAADLRTTGHLDIDMSGVNPTITGALHAETLALPAFTGPLPLTWLQTVSANVHLTADAVTLGRDPALSALSVDLLSGSGIALADAMTATLSGGKLTGQAVADTTQSPPRLALQADLAGASIGGPLGLKPFDLDGGQADLTLALDSTGQTVQALTANLAGTVQANLQSARVTGLDLAAATRALALRPAKQQAAALQLALSQGNSAGLSGELAATIDHGSFQIYTGRLSSPDGVMAVKGLVNSTAGTADLTLSVSPAVAAPPELNVHVSGPWRDAKAVTDISKASSAPVAKAKTKKKHEPATDNTRAPKG